MRKPGLVPLASRSGELMTFMVFSRGCLGSVGGSDSGFSCFMPKSSYFSDSSFGVLYMAIVSPTLMELSLNLSVMKTGPSYGMSRAM